MMSKYGPLPEGWREHYDPGAGRHFFWCTKTDKVSWFPPGHPKAKVTFFSYIDYMIDNSDKLVTDRNMYLKRASKLRVP